MKNYDVRSALPVILQAAKDYDAKLKDMHFLIVYRKKAVIESYCVGFRDMHFMHLTGVRTKMSASMFYSACLEALSAPTCKVLAIFKKTYDSDRFNECTYLSRGYEISRFPEEIRQRLMLK